MGVKATRVALTAPFAALTAVGAYIQIPLYPVPITLQTLFVYLSGILLGGSLGALSQLLYLAMGAAGLPVFAGGRAGVGVLLGPTGGYLMAFPPASFVAGKVAEIGGDGDFRRILAGALIGTTLIYGLGVLQLTHWVNDLTAALSLGVLPFIPGDILKAVLAAYVGLKVRSSLPRIRWRKF